MTPNTFIYVLNDPRTNQLRYVGKSDKPYRRWLLHCGPVRKSTHASRWIAQLRKDGFKPELEVLEDVPCQQWEAIEREYIRVFRMIGIPLTNLTQGGEGLSGLRFSDEHRVRISNAVKGEKNHHFGKTFSPEYCAKMSTATKGRINTPETRAKIASAQRGAKNHHFGKHHTPEARAKLSLANKGKTVSRETRLRLSISGTGRKFSPEVRARMSAAQKASAAKIGHTAAIRRRLQATGSLDLKQCGKCKQIKSVQLFDKSSRQWDGLESRCKLCRSEVARIRHAKKRQGIIAKPIYRDPITGRLSRQASYPLAFQTEAYEELKRQVEAEELRNV